jgi:hypothetical protein
MLEVCVTCYAGDHLEWHALSMQAVVESLFTVQYRSHSVMSPFPLQSLSMLVTSLSCTRRLCKLSLLCVHTVLNRSHFRHVTLLAILKFYAGDHAE